MRTFYPVLLVQIDKANLYRQAGPLAALKSFEHVRHIADLSCHQNVRLIEYLWKPSQRLLLVVGFLLLLSKRMRCRFQESEKGIQLHHQTRFHSFVAGAVCFIEALFLIRYQRIAHVHAHWKHVTDLSTSWEGFCTEAEYRDEEVR